MMVHNPYETNSVLRHIIIDDEDGGWRTKCGLIVYAKFRFGGFEPRLCQDCHETHMVVWS